MSFSNLILDSQDFEVISEFARNYKRTVNIINEQKEQQKYILEDLIQYLNDSGKEIKKMEAKKIIQGAIELKKLKEDADEIEALVSIVESVTIK